MVTSAEITAADFLQLPDDQDYVLLDLRHPDEITRPAPEKNLVNIPLEKLADNLEKLIATKIFTYSVDQAAAPQQATPT